MMTIPEIELAYGASQLPDSCRHPLEVPELTLRGRFYLYGFPVDVRTNSEEILAQFDESFRVFTKRFDTRPIAVDVHVIESNADQCPPAPEHQLLMPLLVWVANSANFAVVDFDRIRTQVVVSAAATRHPLYLRYFFLEAAATCHITSRYTTPVHAGAVALNGRGVLLMGDSGAGKSTLSFACARAGWSYVTDDASMMLNHQTQRIVIGNCHQVRFRPSAAELFPEIRGMPITPRAEGKPSIEFPTAELPHLRLAEAAYVDYIVFLNRNWEGPPQLRPWRRDVARHAMRQVVIGPDDLLALQYETIERLLTAELFELRYNDLDAAIERLQTLVQDGR
jgi:HPr Serine kinase C-terminal domain